MKRTTKAIAASLLALSAAPMLATHAMAATYTRGNTVIEWNGTTLLHAVHLVAVDPWSHESTSWLPVYYLDEAMQKAGFTAAWDGTTGTWSLTVPSTYGMPPDVSNPPSSQATNRTKMAIALNGTVVAYAPRLVAPDPYSGVETTYVPIYYVTQVMKRVGITPTWNGLDWDFQTTLTITPYISSSTPVGNPESQTTMAQAMWGMFDAKTWDVVTHPTMAEAGVTPTSATVTAGDVATWLADWARHALGYVDQGYGTTAPAFHWFRMAYEASPNPFTWGQIYGLYDDTGVTSPTQTLSTRQAQTVLSNLQWWLNGYKVLPDGAYQLHIPLYSHYNDFADEVNAQSAYTLGDYEAVLTEDAKFYDQVTLQQSGADWLLTLPSTQGSPTNVAWEVGYGDWDYGYQGGPSAKGDQGGRMFSIPFKPGVGFAIALDSLDENAFGELLFIPASSSALEPLYVLDGGGMQSNSELPKGLSV
ncbi:hypothetical protein [Alicyclobacillus sp. SP_1]|uniref:hypothetical protein n=1 Tax=Alicyclobacillus sp. SP_1 TaxID=2942475 RepID=UPI002157D628|nr:hypothetical protein [Alicyclobacillus sp. SP_1]